MIEEIKNEGLSSERALELLQSHGPNVIKSKKNTNEVWRIFISQFKSPFIYILIIACIITIIFKDYKDALVIAFAVVLNTSLGFFQEKKAQNAMKALENLLMPKALVIRDGVEKYIEASSLVPKDLVVISAGSSIPADGVILKSYALAVNEANLTGESTAILKEKFDKVYMGTTVVSGKAYIKIEKTGIHTEMGKIGKELGSISSEKTPLQIQISNIAKFLSFIILIVIIALFITGILLGYDLLEVMVMSVAIAVATIPEGLVIAMTVILTVGMQKILKHKAIVRKLVSAETLGSVTVICSDKTGTITEGQLMVQDSELSDKELALELVLEGVSLVDPIEVAMMGWAEWHTKDNKELKYDFNKINEHSFDPDTKISIALLETNIDKKGKEHILFTYGAPEMILRRCDMGDLKFEKEKKNIYNKADSGSRVIALAYKFVGNNDINLTKEAKNLNYLGNIIFEDPIRDGVARAFAQCKRAHIKVKVITGDFAGTAFAVLKKAGLIDEEHDIDLAFENGEIMLGDDLEKISEDELIEKIDNIILFARTSPSQKLKIVNALKKKGEVIAMTGDGVNDSPALKASDIGIVVEDASDVSKQVADIVLLDSNFKTIVKAVEQGRIIFQNLRKVVLYLLSDSFTELIIISVSFILGLPLALTAAQILWINLVQDSFPGIALAFEKGQKDILKMPPRPKNEPILNKRAKAIFVFRSIMTNIILCSIYLYLIKNSNFEVASVQTIIFAILASSSLLFTFSVKSLEKSILKIDPFDNKYLNISVLVGFVMILLAVYVPFLNEMLGTSPLDPLIWLFIMLAAYINLVAVEGLKYFMNKKNY